MRGTCDDCQERAAVYMGPRDLCSMCHTTALLNTQAALEARIADRESGGLGHLGYAAGYVRAARVPGSDMIRISTHDGHGRELSRGYVTSSRTLLEVAEDHFRTYTREPIAECVGGYVAPLAPVPTYA